KFTDQACVIGGCNKEICQNSADESTLTNCQYRQEYVCYTQAVCEKQANGDCGWTQTEQLQSCLLQNQPSPEPQKYSAP
ncbi:MAG: hypothetical protein U0946_05575, partial [Patescibacteria group bacterium]|nr:hypothetical protein [Patescibacteria group bacterium]